MAIAIPSSPSIGQEFIAAGKLFIWGGTSWLRAYTYAIIDGGLSATEISGANANADGGNA